MTNMHPELTTKVKSVIRYECWRAGENKEPALLPCYCSMLTYLPARVTDCMGRTTKLKHIIDTGTAPPIRQYPRRVPPADREVVKELLDQMKRNDDIQPSSSAWASPIVLAKKRDGGVRFCVDFRRMNEITRKDAYPLPRIDDTLETLSQPQLFSTLDLASGYWQVELAEESREKTAFSTTEGLYEFKVMPFELCNAPATFQRLMDLVLSGLQWSNCLVYIDDIMIKGKTFQEHLKNMEQVFAR